MKQQVLLPIDEAVSRMIKQIEKGEKTEIKAFYKKVTGCDLEEGCDFSDDLSKTLNLAKEDVVIDAFDYVFDANLLVTPF